MAQYFPYPMPAQDVKDFWLRCANVNSVLGEKEVNDCYRLTHAFQTHLRNKAETLAKSCPEDPALFVYMADGWSTFVGKVAVARDGRDKEHLKRVGKCREEYLLE